MYHSPSKTRQLLTRLAIYLLMTITVVALVTASVLYLLGYRFNNAKHRIEQSGLVQYISRPNGADVSVDGMSLGQKTPSNSSVTAGKHTFTYSRDGYKTWQKTLDIRPGTLTWLNYARMVPIKLSVSSVAVLPKVAQAVVSPNRQYMIVLPQSGQPSVTIYDLTTGSARGTSITVPEGEYTKDSKGEAGIFSIVELDATSRYILLKHTVGKTIEWLVLDRVGGELVSNVTKTIDLQIKDAHIIDQGGPTLVSLIDDDVRKVNLDRETVSRPVVSHVAEFTVNSKNVITYTSLPDANHQRHVGVVADGGAPVELYDVKNQTARVNVTAGHYFDEDYVAISEGKKVILFAGEFPKKQTDAQQMKK